MCVSGGQAFFTLSGYTIVGRIATMGAFTETATPIDDTVLASTAMEYCPGDTIDYGTVDMAYSWDANAKIDWKNAAMQVNGTPATGTITLKDTTTIDGTGFYISKSLDPIERETRILANYTWQWDGKTVPVMDRPAGP